VRTGVRLGSSKQLSVEREAKIEEDDDLWRPARDVVMMMFGCDNLAKTDVFSLLLEIL
jgi:hypothetical protein